MARTSASRRTLITTGLATLLGSISFPRRAGAAPAEIAVPEGASTERYDFDLRGLHRWTTLDGQWAVEEMPGAPSGRKVLVQRATRNPYNVIVSPAGPYTDVD